MLDLHQRVATEQVSHVKTMLQRHAESGGNDACGWRHDLSDEEILEQLLALNVARAGVRWSSTGNWQLRTHQLQ